MTLHEELRELVTRLGSSVLDDPDLLQGVLDDYVAESDATPADIGLIVAAVRHDGVGRLLGLLENRADAAAAISTAADVVSRRAAVDERGARWAVAALGFALGRVDAGLVRSRWEGWQAGLTTRHAAPFAPPPPPLSPADSARVGPAPVPSPPVPDPAKPGRHEQPDPAVAAPTAARPATAVQPDPPDSPGSIGDSGTTTVPRRRVTGRLRIALVSVVLLIGGIALGGWWMTRGQGAVGPDKSPQSGTTPSGSSTGEQGETAKAAGRDAVPGTLSGSAYVAFASRTSGASRVHVLDLGNGRLRTVEADGEASQPSVSADGRTVAFVVDTDDGRALAVSKGTSSPRILSVGRDLSDPAISPDGSAVAYVTRTENGKDVFLLDLDDSEPRVVAAGSADEFDPTWSADGSRIAYVLAGSADDSIVALDVPTLTEAFKVSVAGHIGSPALAPTGDRVAYVGDVQGNAEVLLTEVGSESTATNLSRSSETETAVVWLDGGRLVTAAAGRGLVTLTLDSADPEMVTSGVGDAL